MSDPLLLDILPDALKDGSNAGKRAATAKREKLADERIELERQKEQRLQSKEQRKQEEQRPQVHTSKPAATKELTDEQKSALLDKLSAYKERFPHLKSRNKLSGKSTTAEVMDEMHYYESQLGGSGKTGAG